LIVLSDCTKGLTFKVVGKGPHDVGFDRHSFRDLERDLIRIRLEVVDAEVILERDGSRERVFVGAYDAILRATCVGLKSAEFSSRDRNQGLHVNVQAISIDWERVLAVHV
jgi:hypothetical protein